MKVTRIKQKVILLKETDPEEFEDKIDSYLLDGWIIKSIIPRHNSSSSSYNSHGHVVILLEKEVKEDF